MATEQQMFETILVALKAMEEKLGNMPQQLPKLLTSNEAAEYLKVKPQTLNLWRTQGISPNFSKVGGKCVRYDTEDLKRYLKEQTVQQH